MIHGLNDITGYVELGNGNMTTEIETLDMRKTIEQEVDCCCLFARNNLIDYMQDRQMGSRFRVSPESRWMLREDFRTTVSAKIPFCLSKEKYRYPHEDKCDKIFAAQWIAPDTICFGTKDNQLLLWKFSTGELTNVILPDDAGSLTAPERTPTPIGEPPINPDSSEVGPLPTTGIHDIDINQSRNLLVSGGKSDHDMVLFSLPSMIPSAILRGHHDCVFASRFIADDAILTGGRDGQLLLWKVPGSSIADEEVSIISPTECVIRSPFRVRSIEYCMYRDRAFVLCGDCSVATVDCHSMSPVEQIPLPEEADLVSLAISSENDMLAVGSQGGTMLLDTHNGRNIAELCDIGLPYGVRSLTFNKDLLTIGGGNGSVDFYDVRMLSRRIPHPLNCSLGSIRATSYYPEVVPYDVPQAVYTLKYDPEYHSKLFVAGGPLLCGLNGSYASVWA